MNHRFSEASTDLLDCIACLDPKNEFSNFDMDKLAHLTDLLSSRLHKYWTHISFSETSIFS